MRRVICDVYMWTDGSVLTDLRLSFSDCFVDPIIAECQPMRSMEA